MKVPLVSIITPSYNSAVFITDTIKSVQSQTYKNWEMIITDDCSTDNTEKIVKSFSDADARIKFFPTNKNSGPAVTRNKGLDKATGDYIAFLDSDDLWHPQKLEKQVRFMQDNNVYFSYTRYDFLNEDGSFKANAKKLPDCISYKGLLRNQVIGCLTVMLDRRELKRIKMPVIRKRQDFAFWLRILKKGYRAHCLQEVLASYRIRKNSVSSNKLKAIRYNWFMYRNIERLSFIRSLYLLTHFVINKILRT